MSLLGVVSFLWWCAKKTWYLNSYYLIFLSIFYFAAQPHCAIDVAKTEPKSSERAWRAMAMAGVVRDCHEHTKHFDGKILMGLPPPRYHTRLDLSNTYVPPQNGSRASQWVNEEKFSIINDAFALTSAAPRLQPPPPYVPPRHRVAPRLTAHNTFLIKQVACCAIDRLPRA